MAVKKDKPYKIKKRNYRGHVYFPGARFTSRKTHKVVNPEGYEAYPVKAGHKVKIQRIRQLETDFSGKIEINFYPLNSPIPINYPSLLDDFFKDYKQTPMDWIYNVSIRSKAASVIALLIPLYIDPINNLVQLILSLLGWFN